MSVMCVPPIVRVLMFFLLFHRLHRILSNPDYSDAITWMVRQFIIDLTQQKDNINISRGVIGVFVSLSGLYI